ncbi:MAG: hypothetical protein IPO18_20495 [bacterium]|nr:hypothetical protein [bacterium]
MTGSTGRWRAGAVAVCFGVMLAGCGARVESPPPLVVPLFEDVTVHFTPADSTRYDTPVATARDNGRVMATYRELSPRADRRKVTLRLAVRPIRQDIRAAWSTAGTAPARCACCGRAWRRSSCALHDRLRGPIEHEVDVTRVAPLLRRSLRLRGLHRHLGDAGLGSGCGAGIRGGR